MADLESLSNEQLRVELLKYGFANIPVTTTTRKVLIKKLKNHLEGEKSKTRRETIHVTKYSSGEEEDVVAKVTTTKKKEANRRATMAAPVTKNQEVNGASGRSSPGRRSMGRSTPQSIDIAPEPVVEVRKSSRTPPRKVAKQPVDMDSVEETDEELQELTRRRKKKSESPALSKSRVVTTSYKTKTVVALEPEIDEPLYVEDNEENDEDDQPLASLPETTNYRRVSPARPGLENSSMRKRTTIASPMDSTYQSKTAAYNRPSLSTSYNYTSPTAKRYTTSALSPPVAPAALNDSLDAEYSSPYLSDFTRRLSQLKPEPLPSAQIKPAIPRGTGYYRTGTRTKPATPADTLGGSIKEVVRSVASYKKTFILIAILLFVIFVLVMFYF